MSAAGGAAEGEGGRAPWGGLPPPWLGSPSASAGNLSGLTLSWFAPALESLGERLGLAGPGLPVTPSLCFIYPDFRSR